MLPLVEKESSAGLTACRPVAALPLSCLAECPSVSDASAAAVKRPTSLISLS